MRELKAIDSQEFVKSVLIKSVTLAFVLSIFLAVVVRQRPVVAGLVVGSLLDIATFFIVVLGLNSYIKSKKVGLIAIGSILRITAKIAVLIIGATNPEIFNLWTTTIGILVVEITIFAEAVRIFIFGRVQLV